MCLLFHLGSQKHNVAQRNANQVPRAELIARASSGRGMKRERHDDVDDATVQTTLKQVKRATGQSSREA